MPGKVKKLRVVTAVGQHPCGGARDRADGGMGVATSSDVKAAARRVHGWLLGTTGMPRKLHSRKRLAIRAGLCAIISRLAVNSIATGKWKLLLTSVEHLLSLVTVVL